MQDIYQQLMAASEKEHHLGRVMPDWLSTYPEMQQRLDAIKAQDPSVILGKSRGSL
ncbi:MAG: hypothetical protein ACR5LC_02875 [Symbiopectobacterium sp.]|uniref:hypothetical protein n=1 Tax=Symbiopectobacterium sp. TaxID=2952789 RepID=UPI003F2B26A2